MESASSLQGNKIGICVKELPIPDQLCLYLIFFSQVNAVLFNTFILSF